MCQRPRCLWMRRRLIPLRAPWWAHTRRARRRQAPLSAEYISLPLIGDVLAPYLAYRKPHPSNWPKMLPHPTDSHKSARTDLGNRMFVPLTLAVAPPYIRPLEGSVPNGCLGRSPASVPPLPAPACPRFSGAPGTRAQAGPLHLTRKTGSPLDCVYRSMSAGYSGPCRPPIPVDAGRVFRSHVGHFGADSGIPGRHGGMRLAVSHLDC